MSNFVHSMPQKRMCLSANTRVLVSGAGYIPASEVTIGSYLVASRSMATTTEVIDVRRSAATDLIQINEEISITEGHPLLRTNGLWVAAEKLKAGDMLMGLNGPRRVETVRFLSGRSSEVIDIVATSPFIVEGFVTMTKSMMRENDRLEIVTVSTMSPSLVTQSAQSDYASIG